jgi:hypothetical protein
MRYGRFHFVSSPATSHRAQRKQCDYDFPDYKTIPIASMIEFRTLVLGSPLSTR